MKHRAVPVKTQTESQFSYQLETYLSISRFSSKQINLWSIRNEKNKYRHHSQQMLSEFQICYIKKAIFKLQNIFIVKYFLRLSGFFPWILGRSNHLRIIKKRKSSSMGMVLNADYQKKKNWLMNERVLYLNLNYINLKKKSRRRSNRLSKYINMWKKNTQKDVIYGKYQARFAVYETIYDSFTYVLLERIIDSIVGVLFKFVSQYIIMHTT